MAMSTAAVVLGGREDRAAIFHTRACTAATAVAVDACRGRDRGGGAVGIQGVGAALCLEWRGHVLHSKRRYKDQELGG